MKALELLKEYKSIDFGCNVEELHNNIDEAIQEIEALSNRSCENCVYGVYGVDSIGIEVECTIGWDCSRGRKDRYIKK